MILKRLCLFSIFCILASTSFAGDTEDKALAELEATLNEAETQTDLNLASYQLSRYLEAQLLQTEASINADLSPDSLELFNKSCQRWREYREAEVIWDGSKYEGGSIQPLIHNMTYISLTKERLNKLREYLNEPR